MEHIWSYFLQLGHNMWRDKWSPIDHRGPMICQATGDYQAEMITDRAVWHEVTDFLPSCGINTLIIDIGEGLQYDSHPELSIPGAWSKEELRAEVKRLRKMGIEPVPKLNFSSCHDTWLGEYAWMKGTQKYYDTVKDLIDEVCALFAPVKYFHLGMDEEDMPGGHRKGITVIRCDALWRRDLYYYIDCVEAHGARPWIWGDYYWYNSGTFADTVPRDCLISNWWYERLLCDNCGNFLPKREMDAYVALHELGYDQVPGCSTWCCHQNHAQTVEFCRQKGLMDEHLLGLMAVPWCKTNVENRYQLLDDAHRLKHAKELFETYQKEGLQ